MNQLPTPEWQGFNVHIVAAWLRGETIQYKGATSEYQWRNIPAYNGGEVDIYRVSNPDYLFRVKPPEEFVVEEAVDLSSCRTEALWDHIDHSKGNNNLRLTFNQEGELTKAEVIK